MQITPMPGASWIANAAAAQQANNDTRSSANASNSTGAAKPTIGDVESSAETLDRDANGQYMSGRSGRDPNGENPDENDLTRENDGNSFLDLPAIGQSSELDLMG